jgi:hypothetical protein
MTPETRFEDRLLTQLRAHVERNAAPGPAPAPRRRALWRPAPIAAAGGLLAAAAVAVVLATGGDGADPAYAVTPQTDGSVTVSVGSLDDAAGLEQALRDAGVSAVVRAVPEGKMCQPQAPATASGAGGPTAMSVSGTAVQGGKATFTVSAGDIRHGETLLITTSGDGTGPSSVSFAMVDAGDTSCELVDAPAPPEPGARTADKAGFVTSGATAGTDAGPATSVAP